MSKLAFDTMSDQDCAVTGCTTKIKQRLANAKPRKCFSCFVAAENSRNHPMVTGHQVRAGETPGKRPKVIPPHILEKLKLEASRAAQLRKGGKRHAK